MKIQTLEGQISSQEREKTANFIKRPQNKRTFCQKIVKQPHILSKDCEFCQEITKQTRFSSQHDETTTNFV